MPKNVSCGIGQASRKADAHSCPSTGSVTATTIKSQSSSSLGAAFPTSQVVLFYACILGRIPCLLALTLQRRVGLLKLENNDIQQVPPASFLSDQTHHGVPSLLSPIAQSLLAQLQQP